MPCAIKELASHAFHTSPLPPLQGENGTYLSMCERTGTASFPLHSVNPDAKPREIGGIIPEERAKRELLRHPSELKNLAILIRIYLVLHVFEILFHTPSHMLCISPFLRCANSPLTRNIAYCLILYVNNLAGSRAPSALIAAKVSRITGSGILAATK
jgi:hypothetical protein